MNYRDPIQRGDVRFTWAKSFDHLPRLVLVLALDDDDEHGPWAEVALVHPATELSCEVDAVVEKKASGFQYDLVVQTDLRGTVWLSQLGGCLGRLDPAGIYEVGRVVEETDHVGEVGIYCGMAGEIRKGDPRWQFKEQEGEALRTLAKDCTTTLLGES